MRGKARTWGTPKTCTIVYRHRKWYASITVECEPVRKTGTGLIGLDFGCNVAVMGAIHINDGEYEQLVIDNPRHLKQLQNQIKQANRQKRRQRTANYKQKIKASKRWRKAQNKVSKLVRKAANQRQDFIHKLAAQIVSSNSLVATEKLNVKNMTRKGKGKNQKRKKGLNKSILDVGFGYLRSAIKYKVVEAGGMFVEVPTQKIKPSQRCPKCHYVKPKTLSQRVHICSKCGYTCDRDFASAQVCAEYVRTGLGTSLDKRGEETSTSICCGGFKQVASAKRQKPPLSCG